jgi:hypothetical protein
MVTGSDPEHADHEGTAEGHHDGAARVADVSNVDAEVGKSCLDDEAGEAEGIDAVEQAEEHVDRDAEPVGQSLYRKVTNLNRFVDEAAKGLDPISMNIWIVLYRFERAGIAWASQKTIAERLGLDPKTVYRHIALLKKKKLLRVVKQGRRGGRCNTYQLGILRLEPVAKRPDRSKREPR